MLQLKNSIYPSSAFGRFWMKLPLVLRSILIGFGVTSLGTGIWVFMVTYIPIPWSAVTFVSMGAILIPYWMYFSGRWKPSNTQVFRRFCIRQISLKRPVWIWGLVAAISIILFLNSSAIITLRIVDFSDIPKSANYLVNDYPAWAAWLLIIMASLVAGICEEIGFRGYMQAPLEKKYGAVVGISITSLVFVVVHLHQAWASGILVHIFVISFMIGYLAYATKSLLPGIIAHVSFDIINFSYWWSDVLGTFNRKTIGITGIDNHFIITVIVVLLSTMLFIVAIRKLLKLKDVAQ